jgi:hypothetical protein
VPRRSTPPSWRWWVSSTPTCSAIRLLREHLSDGGGHGARLEQPPRELQDQLRFRRRLQGHAVERSPAVACGHGWTKGRSFHATGASLAPTPAACRRS